MKKNNKNKKLNIKIERMKKKDLRFLYKMGKAQWGSVNWLTINYFKNSFNQPGLKYVAKSDDKIIGGVILVFEDIIPNWMRYLIVDVNFRGAGIGNKLLKKVISGLKPGESIFLDTSVSNKTAIKFYEENGFKNRGRITSFYGNCPAYFFEKNIK